MSTPLHLILPAAGMGSRFKDAGEMRPKPLIPVFDIPMIVWVLLNFPLNQGDKIWIIAQRSDRLPEQLEMYLSKMVFDIGFIEIDGITEGPASTSALALEFVPENCPVIIANTDQFVFAELSPFVDAVRKNEAQGQILTMKATSSAWSYVGRDEFGQICEVVEKIEISNEATVGVYGWGESRFAVASFRDTFENNIRTNGEFYVAPTYNFLLRNGYDVQSFMVGDHGVAVHGLGTPKDLAEFITNQSAFEFAKKFSLSVG